MKSLKKDIFTEAYQVLLKESNDSFWNSIKNKPELKKILSQKKSDERDEKLDIFLKNEVMKLRPDFKDDDTGFDDMVDALHARIKRNKGSFW